MTQRLGQRGMEKLRDRAGETGMERERERKRKR